jgi:integrase
MASVFFRGPKSAPRFYARFKAADGKWRSRRVRQLTRRDAVKVAQAMEAKAERQRVGLEPSESANLGMRELLAKWECGLVNRAAYDDRSRLRRWVMPKWGGMLISEVTLPAILGWVDECRATNAPPPPTLKHCLTILSRFFSWAIGRGHATANPLRSLPSDKRPHVAPKKEQPWISDPAIDRAIFEALPAPFNLMYFVGARSALRVSEICGLRLSDVEDLGKGCIRVRFSGTGPLKEDRRGTGKVKFAPAPADALEVLGPHIEARKAAGALPEAFLFVHPGGGRYWKGHVEHAWNGMRERLGLTLTFYQATRHSAASRWLSQGGSLDEVSSALGHSTPAITRAHYDHFIRKNFSSALTMAVGAKVIPIGSVRANDAGIVRSQETEEGDHAA